MLSPDLVLLEADHDRLTGILERLRLESNARMVFLLDTSGRRLAQAGDVAGVDATSLAALAAGNVAATEGLAELIGEREFTNLLHEGERNNLHINLVGGLAILAVLFDARSPLGLVRLRVKKATSELAPILDEVATRPVAPVPAFAGSRYGIEEITEEDIDALFN